MKNKSPYLAALLLFTMFACAPKQKETYQTETQLKSQEQPLKALFDTSSITKNGSSENVVTEQSSTAVVLNPPHGQPGHICEIPVGSPLPASTAKTTPATRKIETAQPVKKERRLNPPHGEPGHRCEIAVGAPLDDPAPASGPTSAPAAASSGSFTPTVENAARLKPGQR